MISYFFCVDIYALNHFINFSFRMSKLFASGTSNSSPIGSPRIAPDNYVWICDMCGKAKFRIYDEALAHEKICSGVFEPEIIPIWTSPPTAAVPLPSIPLEHQDLDEYLQALNDLLELFYDTSKTDTLIEKILLLRSKRDEEVECLKFLLSCPEYKPSTTFDGKHRSYCMLHSFFFSIIAILRY